MFDMDPFTEKEIVDNLKSIASSLRDMKKEMADMNLAIREAAANALAEEEDYDEEGLEGEDDSEEILIEEDEADEEEKEEEEENSGDNF